MAASAATPNLDAFLQEASRFHIRRVVCETPHGIFMVDPRDKEIGRSLLVHGEFEYHEKRDWFEFIPKSSDKLFVDIGANIGTTSIPILLDKCVGRVLAFEPDPDNFHLLQYNIGANGLGNRITAVQCALSNSSGTVRFERSAENFGDHRVRYQDLPGGSYNEGTRTTIEVPCMTLDDILGREAIDAGRIAAVKCDTQGSEGFILEGAQKLLQSKIPWIIEFWPYGLQRAGFDRARFVSLVSGAFATFVEFKPGAPARRRPTGDIGRLFGEYPGTSFCNLILMPG
jgi:FkbM family methyltransferase